MANVSGTGYVWNLPQYLGPLFMVGQNQTPFLNVIGGLEGSRVRVVNSLEFPVSVSWSLESASQPALTEEDIESAPTATGYVRSQDTNTVQYFHRAVKVTYPRISTMGWAKADATTGLLGINEEQAVQDELDFQIQGNLLQIAKDCEYTFINGVYQKATAKNVAPKTRGILAACSTNAIDAGGAALDKTLFEQLLRTMYENGAPFNNPVVLCGAVQKQKLSSIYGYAPEDRNIGGVNIKQIECDFGVLGVLLTPQMPSNAIAVVEIDIVRPVVCPVPGKGGLFYEPLSKSGAVESGQIFGQLGLDYGEESWHGKLTNLAT